MQAINRIQIATINANAGHQAAMVVGGANANRAYPSMKPGDKTAHSNCPGRSTVSQMQESSLSSEERLRLMRETGCEGLTTGPTGRTWRFDNHQTQTPATIWAALVLNRHLCG